MGASVCVSDHFSSPARRSRGRTPNKKRDNSTVGECAKKAKKQKAKKRKSEKAKSEKAKKQKVKRAKMSTVWGVSPWEFPGSASDLFVSLCVIKKIKKTVSLSLSQIKKTGCQ